MFISFGFKDWCAYGWELTQVDGGYLVTCTEGLTEKQIKSRLQPMLEIALGEDQLYMGVPFVVCALFCMVDVCLAFVSCAAIFSLLGHRFFHFVILCMLCRLVRSKS
jgi:hypothetical protein